MKGKWQKIVCMIFVVLFVFCFTACNGGNQDETVKTIDDEKDLSAPALDDPDYTFLHDRDYKTVAELKAEVKLPLISGQQIKDAYTTKKITANMHPRVLSTSKQLESVRELLKTNATLQKLYRSVKSRADSVLDLGVPTYADNDPQRLTAVHTYGPGLIDSAYYYTLSSNRNDPTHEDYKKYREKSLSYVKAICNFQDWGPGHQLDLFVATASIGLYYDIMYEYLSPADRTVIINAIVAKGIGQYFSQACSGIDSIGMDAEPIGIAGESWATYVNNWNGVCNGGFLAGALAVIGDTGAPETDKLCKAMAKAYNNTSYLLQSYAPEGLSEEGYMYWEYAMMYLEFGWLGFDNMLGTTFGWLEQPIFEKLAYGQSYEGGAVAGSSVGDDTVKNSPSSVRISLAYLLDKGDLQRFRLETAREDKLTFREVIYFNPEYDVEGKIEIDQDKDLYVRGLENVNLRTGYDKSDTFASIHVGPNNASHGHLDAGQFDLQGNGVSYVFGSLGRDDYNLVPGYFANASVPSYTETDLSKVGVQTTACRNHIYRIRTESKSAVTIKPLRSRDDIRPEQKETGVPKVERVLSRIRGGFTTVDMTDVYERDVTSYKRGVKIRRDLDMVTLQDEIELQERSWIYWSVNLASTADVAISEDKRSALIKVMDEVMYVEIAGDNKYEFTMGECTYIQGTQLFPLSTNQASNSFKKLMILAAGRELSQTISVNFIMLEKWETEPSFTRPAVKAMKDWNIPAGEMPEKTEGPTVSTIKIDGTPIENFDPNKTVYTHTIPLEQDESPVVTAYANSGIAVKTEVRGKEYAFVYATENGATRVYSIKFVTASAPATATLLNGKITRVTASAYQIEGDHNPNKAIDGDENIESRWSAEGVQYLQFELDAVYQVGFISMMTWNSNTRQMSFNVELSEDGENYVRMYEDNISTNGMTPQTSYESFKFTMTSAKYVRLVCYGTNEGSWNSVIEVKLFGA